MPLPLAAESFRTARRWVSIRGNKFTLREKDKVKEAATFKTDATKDPRTIALMIESGKDKGKTQRGIYRRKGSSLRIALAPPGAKERPGAFNTEEGSAIQVYSLSQLEPRPGSK